MEKLGCMSRQFGYLFQPTDLVEVDQQNERNLSNVRVTIFDKFRRRATELLPGNQEWFV